MKKTLLLAFFSAFAASFVLSQEQMVLRKGEIIEAIPVQDSVQNTFSLYLPTNFSTDKKWPLLMIFEMEGKERQAMSMFVQAAEKQGYVLAAPKMRDTVSLTNSMIAVSKSLERTMGMLPIDNDRIYAGGAASGGRFASLAPILLNGIKGVISVGASIANRELLNLKQPFHFVGIVSRENYNYTPMLNDAELLDRLKFPNQVLLYEGNGNWPSIDDLEKGMQFFTLAAMGRRLIPKDSLYVEKAYREDLDKVNQLQRTGDLLWAEQFMTEMMSVYGAHKNLDSLRTVQRDLRRDKQFKAMKRNENSAFLKESLLKEDYLYYMEEDVYTHNFNNLGWWNHQMGEIKKFISGSNPYEKQMGHRLLGFVNALALDNIEVIQSDSVVDEDALAFLYMLKTILDPENFDYYLKTISLSAKNEDFGTALFYLEEVLKKGFKDREKLYSIENTALFRITPEFNEMVAKYLKDARYEMDEN
ncbi:hypothetical protein SAMN04487891_102172 [Flagellimonas taeanensis]|uniref:Alpha/beta hydrolase n=1 Tax=Flagellimonas taeanensis TaxID=1005926 RepID=A0A1M6RQT2_9FLAO|nr:alpha/beta hydrolase [Allomuricauda taeanensis]SFB76305.1 hypothetical protein SAMN04487891_102172 [Allomuricauda taeanensis]SHK34815.1 hypothetical protein SAMN05216293_0849 [Allomuricauda taeanensis]